MRRISQLGAVVLIVAASITSVVQAKAIAIFPNRSPAQQAMQAEVIVVGKVTEIEKELSLATPFANSKDKIGYRIGVVQIAESLQGAKGLTTIRVGWQPIPEGNPSGPGGGLRVRPLDRRPQLPPQVALIAGQEGCFFLTKHHDGDFYVMLQWSMPLDKKAADFGKSLESIKKIVKIYDDPKSGLTAKETADRQFAAALLVQKYRIPVSFDAKGQPKQADIEADQSKLIMQIVSEMEWNKFDQKDGVPISANNIFGMLGIQPGQHGFDPPKFQPNQADYAKVYGQYVMKWIKENGDKYRIQRYVAAQ